MTWTQIYDPLGNVALSALCAALPVATLLGALGIFRVKAHWAALAGLAVAFLVAVLVFHMPAPLAWRSAGLGVAYGLLPIGWIILNIIFLYRLAEEQGLTDELKDYLTSVTGDPRLQLLLVAFCLGAFFEGAAGFGAPVAITGAILIGLGFRPLHASGLSLIANTAPVAFGALGTPLVALHATTGLDLYSLSAMVGRQLPFFSVLVPFWLIAAFAGFRGMIEVWPAALVTGLSFAAMQFLVSNFHGPWLVDIVAAATSTAALVAFLRVWRPKGARGAAPSLQTRPGKARALLPWAILCVTVFLWGLPSVRTFLDGLSAFKLPVIGLDGAVLRAPPVVPAPHAESAVFALNWLSATGTGILAAAILSGILLRVPFAHMVRLYAQTVDSVKASLLTIAAMMAIGFTTRYAGIDAALGLAFAHAGYFYPFFGTLLGWLGTALTGSDTASNVLFGGLQTASAAQLGLNPVLMAAANSSGGVMGKMIDAQSIVVASTATRWFGQEGAILRFVFLHSLALAALVGVLVMLQAHFAPFIALTVH